MTTKQLREKVEKILHDCADAALSMEGVGIGSVEDYKLSIEGMSDCHFTDQILALLDSVREEYKGKFMEIIDSLPERSEDQETVWISYKEWQKLKDEVFKL